MPQTAALRNVAASHVEVRGYGPSSVRWRGDGPNAAERPDGVVTAGFTVASSHMQQSGGYVDSGSGRLLLPAENSTMASIIYKYARSSRDRGGAGLGGLELGPLGTQLGTWFEESSEGLDLCG